MKFSTHWENHEAVDRITRHFPIVELVLAGEDRKDIATRTGLTTRTILNVMRSPVFERELARRRDLLNRQIDEVLTEKSVEAVATLGELLDSPDEGVRLRAANSILDRTGFAPGAERQRQPQRSIVGDANDLSRLRIALAESQGHRPDAIPDLVA